MLESNTTKGDNSPVQSNNGNDGLNVGGGIENLYYNTNPQDDINLLSNIFEYIKQNTSDEYPEETKGGKGIKEKSLINFEKHDEYEQFRSLYSSILQSGIYSTITQFMEIKEHKLKVINYIRAVYINKYENFQSKIDLCKKITTIANELIPNKYQKDVNYNNLATGLIVFVFEMCDIGMKTEEEKLTSNYLF